MSKESSETGQIKLKQLLMSFIGLPWVEVVDKLWPFGQKMLQNFATKGVYEVLDYESTLEIKDRSGTRATFKKRKKIRYLQDDVIAYQDYAWGDGEILLNYRTNRGKPVDRYKSGYKTYVLLSLRDVKNRGDIDEFNIQWNIRRGFLKEDGFWGADVSQPMKHLKVNLIFPKTRPPQQLSLEESNRRRTCTLGIEALQELPDGRLLVTWETNQPRLHELYVLRWIW